MHVLSKRVALVVFCLGLAFLVVNPAKPHAEAEKGKNETFKGKVTTLASVLEKAGARLDADAAPYSLVLVTEDGKIYPLVKDDGSRLFFKDSRLLNRPMRLTGRLVPKSELLQVVAVQSYNKKNELCDVYYWCDICSIRRGEKMTCECCGGPMELREEPVKK
jgi:hypothetical protein